MDADRHCSLPLRYILAPHTADAQVFILNHSYKSSPLTSSPSPHNFPSYQSQHSIIPLSILALNLALKNHALCFCFWLVLCVIMILVLALSCRRPPWVTVPGFNSFIQLTLHGGGRPRQGVRVSWVRDAINGESLGLLMWKDFPCSYFRLLLRQVWDSVMSYF